jgi:hypothetical protein
MEDILEVGKVLIEKKGADTNAAPVPATRDTALTAADKGHYRFVELLISM